jgi:hypothetical protein
MKPIRILFLSANPSNTTQLRLSEEVRTIDERLRASEVNQRFDLAQAWAVRETDLADAMLRHKPHIVHFSGHGSTGGEVILEDNLGKLDPVSPQSLSELFGILSDNIQCVVLNACFSETQAQAIVKHVPCVVGMSNAIDDASAVAFAGGFYRGLGWGQDVQTAFRLGCNEISLSGLKGADIPKLLHRDDVDPSNLHLISESLPFETVTVEQELIRLDVLIVTTGQKHTIKVTPDVAVGRLAPVLAEKLGLPSRFENGMAVQYRLENRTQRHRLDDNLTLRENGIQEGDTLVFTIDMVAG